MEKILRKVKCSERLPTEEGYRFVLMPTSEKRKLMFIKLDNTWYSDANEIKNPEYWYEEVELDLIAIERLGLKDKFIHSELFAKERYEKALNYIEEHSGNIICYLEEARKALRIAAGLEEV
jgi:hypothetical protein